MKKGIALLLALIMVIGLVACGEAEPTTSDIPNESKDSDVTTTPSQEETDPTQVENVPDPTDEQTIPVAGNENLALAESCIDKSVDELYALIGEPLSADYAPSCLNPGVGEDGNLEYDGFIVYTYREGDTETVQDVEETE